MKCLLIIHLLILVIFYGFAEFKPDPIVEFIPGTYIRFSQHEFGTEYDTLVITPQNNTTNEYTILRKWKYERMLDGSNIEPEYKRLTTSGIYNAKHKLLEETGSGDIFSFDVKGKLLFNGPTTYHKL